MSERPKFNPIDYPEDYDYSVLSNRKVQIIEDYRWDLRAFNYKSPVRDLEASNAKWNEVYSAEFKEEEAEKRPRKVHWNEYIVEELTSSTEWLERLERFHQDAPYEDELELYHKYCEKGERRLELLRQWRKQHNKKNSKKSGFCHKLWRVIRACWN